MEREEIVQKFYSQSKEEQEVLLERLIFCNFSDEKDFENYFKVEELGEGELFCLISFLYHQDCFFMMLDIIDKHRKRFLSEGSLHLEEFDFSEKFLSRWIRLENFAKG